MTALKHFRSDAEAAVACLNGCAPVSDTERLVALIAEQARRIDALERRVAELEHDSGLPDSMQWAMNSGDGSYRP